MDLACGMSWDAVEVNGEQVDVQRRAPEALNSTHLNKIA
jgi:hypothetical protein